VVFTKEFTLVLWASIFSIGVFEKKEISPEFDLNTWAKILLEEKREKNRREATSRFFICRQILKDTDNEQIYFNT